METVSPRFLRTSSVGILIFARVFLSEVTKKIIWSSVQNGTDLRPDSGSATSNGSICDVPEATSSLDGGVIRTPAGAAYLAAGIVRGTRHNTIQAHHSPLRLVLSSLAVCGFTGRIAIPL